MIMICIRRNLTVTMFLVLLLVLVSPAWGKYMEGELNTGENWAFLARFCFLSLSGMFEYDIEYPEVSRKCFHRVPRGEQQMFSSSPQR